MFRFKLRTEPNAESLISDHLADAQHEYVNSASSLLDKTRFLESICNRQVGMGILSTICSSVGAKISLFAVISGKSSSFGN